MLFNIYFIINLQFLALLASNNFDLMRIMLCKTIMRNKSAGRMTARCRP